MRFWDLMLFPVLLPLVLLRVPGKQIIDIPLPVDDSSTLISRGYDRTRPSKPGKGVISVSIVTNLVTKLISVIS